MGMAFDNGQSGIERRPEHRCRHLTDAAAPFELGTVADDRIPLHKPVCFVDFADLGIERKDRIGGDEHTIDARCAGGDIGDPVGCRPFEATAASTQHIGKRQLANLGSVEFWFDRDGR